MTSVNQNMLLYRAEELDKIRIKIKEYIDQIRVVESQVAKESYLENNCILLDRLVNNLSEYEVIIGQMSRVLRRTCEIYGQCEINIIEKYETGGWIYPVPGIGISRVLINNNMDGLFSILLKDDGD